MSRVQSDALPLSLTPKMITCEPPPIEVKGQTGEELAKKALDVPDFLSDANSLAVEIGSSMDAESVSEKLSFTGSHRSVSSLGNEVDGSSEQHGEGGRSKTDDSGLLATSNTEDTSSIMDSILAVARRHSESQDRKDSDAAPETPPAALSTRSIRPISAPAKARSVSAGDVGLGGRSRTLPSNVSVSELRKLVANKRVSQEEERRQRRVTIEEGAMAALKVS